MSGHSGSEDSAATPMATEGAATEFDQGTAAAPHGHAHTHDRMDEDEPAPGAQRHGAPVVAQRYYDIVEPAAALKALEVELETLVASRLEDGSVTAAPVVCEAVCQLIKQECDAEVRP